MEYIHYFIVVPIIVIIILYQLKIFRQALEKIKKFKDIFPSNRLAYSVNQVNITVREDADSKLETLDKDPDLIWSDNSLTEDYSTSRDVEVSQIHIKSENPTVMNIKNALNMYLQKNKGAASDFSLMKDVVERYCGADEEEISVMQPIPLYMGLMGTMVGIIVGISIIAFNGGVDNLKNVSSMMICVAIAMAASFVGILCTTVISWKSKGAKSEIEANKNMFYSWLQTELLPVLSGNSITALSLLQNNLMTFNQTFQGNIKEFDTVLSKVRQVSKDQADALGAISRINITKVAEANISVLRELQNSTNQIEQFNQYLTSVNGYLSAVNSLNENLNNHLDRTAVIENMGVFFERELTQVQTREDYIKQVVVSIDSTLEQTFNQLKESMSSYMNLLKEQTSSDIETLKDTYQKQQQEFVEKLKSQQESLLKKTEDVEKVINNVQNLSEAQNAIKSLFEVSRGNSKRLDQIVGLLESGILSVPHTTSASYSKEVNGKIQKWVASLNVSLKIAAIIAFIMFAIEFVANYILN